MTPRHLTFHFVLRDAAGTVLDTTLGGEPATCVEGAGQVIDGLEAALVRMRAGESLRIVIAPEQAYGARDDGLIQRVPRSHLPVDDVRPGDRFQTGPDRHAPVVTVIAVDGEVVVLDANHPLAGQELHFEVDLVAERAATPSELKDGAQPQMDTNGDE